MERTLVILKPDTLERGLAGEIISRFERRGFRMVALRLITIDSALARAHYAEHEGKPFLEDLISFITSGPSVVMVLECEGAVTLARNMIGDKDPFVAPPGTVRGDFASTARRNMIHASDSLRSAAREIELFFGRLPGPG